MNFSRIRKITVFSALSLFLPFIFNSENGLGQERRLRWVGLFNSEMIAWLENENQMANLCPDTLPSDRKSQCEAERRRPKQWEIGVFAIPSEGTHRIGRIIVTATPGRPLVTSFQESGSSIQRPFQTDLYLEDWGYGPYFHQTIVEQRGPWFLLPKNPFPAPAWINLNDISKEFDTQTVEVGGIYELETKSIVIVAYSQSGIVVRQEQPADMWCRDGDPPPLIPSETVEIKYQDLFDKDGHLKIRIKYVKGC